MGLRIQNLFMGIDNGVSGTIGSIWEDGTPHDFVPAFVTLTQDYTKKKKNINRIDHKAFRRYIRQIDNLTGGEGVRAFIERPMVNPGRFQATASALRSLEATLICLESFSIGYQFVDSKEWQKLLLPKDIKGEELKRASMDIGIRRFPVFKKEILKHKDADGLLIAEAARKMKW